MNRQVYQSTDTGTWKCIGREIIQTGKEVVGFESLDGFTENEIYAAGWHGEIWLYNGIIWQQVSGKKDILIRALCCHEDGFVFAAAQDNRIFKGKKDRREEVLIKQTANPIEEFISFQSTLYTASSDKLFTLQDDSLAEVDFGSDWPSTCGYLSRGDGILVCAGAKGLFSFDGQKWTRLD